MNPRFSPAWWLPGPHLQTAWGRIARLRRQVAFVREVLATSDGDEIVLDHVEGPAGAPRLIVLHGLEGSSNSVYVQGFLAAAARLGWRGTAMNFRSCARDPRRLSRMLPNRRPRLYHSGETSDFDYVIAKLASREPGTPLLAVGASLGGNVLLKWLGENPGQRMVMAAAAVSTPYDLAAGSRHLETRLGRFYVRGFLTRIETPTLCLSALDDPFLPASVPARARSAASPAVNFVTTDRGGHIGFVSGAGARYWAEQEVAEWFGRFVP